MQNHDWIELFRQIPENQHNVLVMTTLSGVDLNIEMIVRTDLNYLVFRGRVSGNTDEGRLFFLPYRQIDFLQLNRQLKESDINEILSIKPDPAPAPKSGFMAAPGSSPGSGAFAPAPKSTFGSSPQVVPLTPNSPATVGAPRPAATRPAASPTLASRLTNVPAAALQPPGVSPRMSNVPAAALIPPPTHGAINGAEASAPAPPRNSILERLRAQRNAILPQRPPGR